MLLITLDIDGNINFEITANYDKSEYIEKGVNIYSDEGSGKINHSTEKSIHKVGNEKISFINVDAKSKEELDEDPDATCSVKGEGTLDYKASLNGSCGVMLNTIIPAYINAEAGIRGEGYISGKLEYTNDNWKFNGGISMKNQIFAKIIGLIKIKFEGDALDKSIKKKYRILEKVFFDFKKSTFNFKGVYYVGENTKKTGISGAQVTLKSTEDGTYYYAKTDEEGNFTIPNMVLDEYEIKITKDGYRPIKKTIEIDVNSLEFDGKTDLDKTIDTEVNKHENDFYCYTYNPYSDSYKISLNENFKNELEKDSGGELTGNGPDNKEISWRTGEPLPNPIEKVNESKINDMSYMFNDCGVKSLDLSKFDTSKIQIMDEMFKDCSQLKVLEFGDFDTSSVISMNCMFEGCQSLTSIDLHKFSTSSVTDMSYLFSGCSNLKSLDLNNFDTSKVKFMWGMFNGCSSLQTLDLSKFDTSRVVSMDGLFCNCSSLSSLDLSNFDTLSLGDMHGMFAGCTNLKSLDLTDFNTSKVEDMGLMFSDCENLQSLDLNDFNTSNVFIMNEMFKGCRNLNSIELSDFDTSKVQFMDNMFNGCENLNSINLSNFVTSKVTNMSGMFKNCKNLHSLDLSGFNISKSDDKKTKDMFYGACANANKLIKGYTKDEDTADKFNNSSNTGIDTSKLKFEAK